MFSNDRLQIFDATRAVIILNYTDQPVDHIGNVVTITTYDVFPNDGVSLPRSISQPNIPIHFSALIYFVTSQAVRNTQDPNTTPKFVHIPCRINLKIINYKTKAGEALYKQATRLL